MERRGKSSPARQATACKCKPYPEQHRMRSRAGHSPRTAVRGSPGTLAAGAVPVRHIPRVASGARQRASQTDGSRAPRRVQNPAYKPAQKYPAVKTAGYLYHAPQAAYITSPPQAAIYHTFRRRRRYITPLLRGGRAVSNAEAPPCRQIICFSPLSMVKCSELNRKVAYHAAFFY